MLFYLATHEVSASFFSLHCICFHLFSSSLVSVFRWYFTMLNPKIVKLEGTCGNTSKAVIQFYSSWMLFLVLHFVSSWGKRVHMEMLSFPTTSLKVPQYNCSVTCYFTPHIQCCSIEPCRLSWSRQRTVLCSAPTGRGISQDQCQVCWDNEEARVWPKMFWMLFIVLFIYWLIEFV